MSKSITAQQQFTMLPVSIEQIQQMIEQGIQAAFERKANEKGPYDDYKPFLTRKEAAQILNVSVGTIDKWTVQGQLKQYQQGTIKRYKKHEIVEFLKTY